MIYAIGPEAKIPSNLPNHLFYGLFRCLPREAVGKIPVADCEGYYYDKKRGIGSILPCYITGIDAKVCHKTNRVCLHIKKNPNTLFDYDLEYICFDEKQIEPTTIWKDTVSPEIVPKIKSSLIEFADFFGDLSIEFVTQG